MNVQCFKNGNKDVCYYSTKFIFVCFTLDLSGECNQRAEFHGRHTNVLASCATITFSVIKNLALLMVLIRAATISKLTIQCGSLR